MASLAAALSVPWLGAQSADSAARLALLDAVEAHGGQGTLAGLGDTTAVGTIAIAKREGVEECSLTVKSRGLGAHRSEVSCPRSGNHVWITDGRWGWVLVDGSKTPLGLDETADSPQVFNPALGVLGLFVRGRFQPEAVAGDSGSVTVSGRVAGSLRPDGSPVPDRPLEIELDPATKLVRVLRVWERSRDGRLSPWPVEYRYSDWRRAAGLIVPFRVEEVRYGTVVSIVSLSSFAGGRHGEIFSEP